MRTNCGGGGSKTPNSNYENAQFAGKKKEKKAYLPSNLLNFSPLFPDPIFHFSIYSQQKRYQEKKSIKPFPSLIPHSKAQSRHHIRHFQGRTDHEIEMNNHQHLSGLKFIQHF